MVLAGKTVVIRGIGAGLGRKVATLAIRDGANLVLGAHTESQLERFAELAMKHFGRIDALVEVAALDTAFGGLRDGDLDDFQRTNEVNVVGSARMVKAVGAPHAALRRRLDRADRCAGVVQADVRRAADGLCGFEGRARFHDVLARAGARTRPGSGVIRSRAM